MQFKSKVAAVSIAAVATSVVAAMPAMAASADSATTINMGECSFTVVGNTYTLTDDCATTTTLEFDNGVTVNGNSHTITAVEGVNASFPGPVVKSATGTDIAPASFHVSNLTIDTDFPGNNASDNSAGRLAGIEMIRAGGSLKHVTVNGISHGNGVQEGRAIKIWNSVLVNEIPVSFDVPPAKVTLEDVKANNYQKTGVHFDGNLNFTARNLTVGAASTADGTPMMPGTIASNSVTITRGASGSLTDSEIASNDYDGADIGTGILMYNARNVELARNTVTGPGDAGVYAYNMSDVLTTNLVMSNMVVDNPVGTPGSVGVHIDNKESTGGLNVRVTDTEVTGWETQVIGTELTASSRVDVTGHATTTKIGRKARIDMYSNGLRPNTVQGKKLAWKIAVDGRAVFGTQQSAGSHDRWVRTFGKNTGTHKVELFKNSVRVETMKVRTNA